MAQRRSESEFHAFSASPADSGTPFVSYHEHDYRQWQHVALPAASKTCQIMKIPEVTAEGHGTDTSCLCYILDRHFHELVFSQMLFQGICGRRLEASPFKIRFFPSNGSDEISRHQVTAGLYV